jgi:hypothetical protein
MDGMNLGMDIPARGMGIGMGGPYKGSPIPIPTTLALYARRKEDHSGPHTNTHPPETGKS